MVFSASAKVRGRISRYSKREPRTEVGVAGTMSEPFAQYPYGAYPVPEPPRRHRGRHALGLTATAVVALAVGAGAGIGLSQGGSTPTGNATATSKTMLT